MSDNDFSNTTPPAAKMRLGELLVHRGKLDPEFLEFALKVQSTSNMRLGEILVANNLANEHDVYSAIAEQSNVDFVNTIAIGELDLPDAFKSGSNLLQLVKIMKQHLIVPLSGNRLVAAEPAIASKFAIMLGVRKIYGAAPTTILGAIENLFLDYYDKHLQHDYSKFNEEQLNQTVDMLVDAIIRKAIVARASDIHFELEYPSCYVRYRIDGDLVAQGSYDIRLHNYIANIILMRSLGNPSNNKRFDDASFDYWLSDNIKVALRVSKVPTEHGAAIVLRILRQDNMLISMEKLGFLDDQIEVIKRLVRRPYGVILVCGPTGSGKSTSLYSLVGEVRGKDTKIVSIEDPIEINVPLVEQVQINEAAGITFDKAIRAFLRHDPDVILVGEIRDSETAKMAIEASMTGHIVLSSIHTNSAFDVFARLAELNVSHSKLTAIVGLIGQRLIKRVCTDCNGDGCPRCGGTGYHGRVVCSEVLEFTEPMKEFLYKNDIPGLMKYAIKEGFQDMASTAERLIEKGIISREEAAKNLNMREKPDNPAQ